MASDECVDVDESESAKIRRSAKKMLQQEKEEESDSEPYSRTHGGAMRGECEHAKWLYCLGCEPS